jgi:hypothetical protein
VERAFDYVAVVWKPPVILLDYRRFGGMLPELQLDSQ